jgi:3-hydroxyacyl-[acyl-carrier-protein] dehydratase
MTSELRIAADHPAFAGHFPGFPILPGAVLLDEALHQIARSHDLDLTRWQIATVKFLETVHPGDVLALEHSTATDTLIRFAIRREGSVVASGTLSAPSAGAVDDLVAPGTLSAASAGTGGTHGR